MIRKRLSKSVPGEKRPWLIESDAVSQPVEAVEADVPPFGAAIRCEAPADDPLGDKRVTFSSPEIVSASLPDRWPQEGQNRASCGISAAQSTHRTMGFYAKQAWQLIREA